MKAYGEGCVCFESQGNEQREAKQSKETTRTFFFSSWNLFLNYFDTNEQLKKSTDPSLSLYLSYCCTCLSFYCRTAHLQFTVIMWSNQTPESHFLLNGSLISYKGRQKAGFSVLVEFGGSHSCQQGCIKLLESTISVWIGHISSRLVENKPV